MAHDIAMRRHRAGACRWRCIAPPRTPPNTPPALKRRDEAAEAQTMLYSSYGQKGGCNGYMDNLKVAHIPNAPTPFAHSGHIRFKRQPT